MGSARLHDIIPTLIHSPIMRDLAWSPLVNYAFQKNQHHFTTLRKPSLLSVVLPFLTSRGSSISYESGSDMTPTPPVSKIESLPVLALHLRRGDFIEHCDNLYNWNSTYTGFNTQPSLPDRFFMENATMRDSMSTDEIKEAYKQKCLIDVGEVRKRVVRAVTEWRNERLQIFERQQRNRFMAAHNGDEGVKEMLRKVYIMTNGDREFLNQLKSALLSDAQRSALRIDNKLIAEDANANSTNGSSSQYDYDFVWSWDEISTSRDMDIGWETKYVAQAMDMYVGQRAEVFIGNGFSSLTANVVLLRTVAGVEPWRTRFWWSTPLVCFLEAGLFFGRMHPFSSVNTWDISHSFFPHSRFRSFLYFFIFISLGSPGVGFLIYIPLLIALDEGFALLWNICD